MLGLSSSTLSVVPALSAPEPGQNARRCFLSSPFPSPESSTVEIGPLSIHFYGLTLLVAIAAAVVITGIRWTRRGGDWDLIFRLAVWGVASGIIGARLYHVITSWDELPDEWWGPFAIWKGGLGVWGGIGLGVIVGAIVAKRSGADVPKLMDCVAPGLLVAQGIGRFGNWWNQELFGGPTDLPWGLEISPANRPIEHVEAETFHPTFLYEALWSFGAAGLLAPDRAVFRIRPGGLFALYVLLYSIGRLWIEFLRVDPSHELAGVRLNAYVAALAIIVSAAFFVFWQRTWKRGTGPPPRKVEAMAVPRDR